MVPRIIYAVAFIWVGLAMYGLSHLPPVNAQTSGLIFQDTTGKQTVKGLGRGLINDPSNSIRTLTWGGLFDKQAGIMWATIAGGNAEPVRIDSTVLILADDPLRPGKKMLTSASPQFCDAALGLDGETYNCQMVLTELRRGQVIYVAFSDPHINAPTFLNVANLGRREMLSPAGSHLSIVESASIMMQFWFDGEAFRVIETEHTSGAGAAWSLPVNAPE